MPFFLVETTATASIREFWRVEADDAASAEAQALDGTAQFIGDEVTGFEEDRQIREVHTGPYAASLHPAIKARSQTASILQAIQNLNQRLEEGMTLTESDPEITQLRQILNQLNQDAAYD